MKRIIQCIIAICMCGAAMVSPVFAAGSCPDGCVPTSVLGDGDHCFCDNNNDGSGVYHILILVINIMTACLITLAIIGITVAGIQYLTAGGDEGKVKKAKRRIFEIVIGLLAYVVVAIFLGWLIPNFVWPK